MITFPDNTELWTTIDPTTGHSSLICPLTPSVVQRPLPSVATVQLSFFSAFSITENAVIDITIQEMVTNIAPLHTFQI